MQQTRPPAALIAARQEQDNPYPGTSAIPGTDTARKINLPFGKTGTERFAEYMAKRPSSFPPEKEFLLHGSQHHRRLRHFDIVPHRLPAIAVLREGGILHTHVRSSCSGSNFGPPADKNSDKPGTGIAAR